MKEAPLTINNFWGHPRFWRHLVGWVVWISLSLCVQFFSKPNKVNPSADISYIVLSYVMIILTIYGSFYLYEHFYKKNKKALFFMLHIPQFIFISILGRGISYWQGLVYDVNIWAEITGVPIILISIYLVKFIYHGIVDNIQLKRLRETHTQTELRLIKTQLKPNFLIEVLMSIHRINLKDTEAANEAILTLADNLRQRLDKEELTQNSEVFTEKVMTEEKEAKISTKTNTARIKRHIATWLFFSCFLIINKWAATKEAWSTWNDTLFIQLILLWLYAFLIYISIYLYEKFITQKKYWRYALIQILWLVAFAFVLFQARSLAVDMGVSDPNNTFLKALTASIMALSGALGLKVAYHLTKKSFSLNALKVKQTETELKLLKSQINPHFLFNILNNIYAKNLDDAPKANEYIIGLTQLLKYQTISQQKQFIQLDEEVDIAKNYIALEEIRLHNCEVTIAEKGNFATFKIIPLLLLPLVENAFKYGTGLAKGQINFYFEQNGNQFSFSSKNKIIQANKKRRSTGIGLDNVQKRLNIIYPKKHVFKTEIIENTFIVTLNITL